MTSAIGIPERDEAAPYYHGYIAKVPGENVIAVLEKQAQEFPQCLAEISEEKSLHRYAPDKWTIRELLSHINDTERVFQFRAFWFARGFEAPQASFDQNLAINFAGANQASWKTHIEEFRAVRQSTLALFRNLPEEAWRRSGIASDNRVTVRALAYITAGHVEHHAAILRQRYL